MSDFIRVAEAKKMYHNNVFFGDISKLTKVERPAKAKAADANGIDVILYISQFNFVDTQPSAPVGGGLPLLPGQPMNAPGKFINLTIPGSTGTFEDVINAAELAGFIDNVAIAQWGNARFLLSYDFGGATYSSVQTASYGTNPTPSVATVRDPATPTLPQTDPDLSGIWAGWSPTYFTGIVRPARFESYPLLAINQYTIHAPVSPPAAPLIFTLDYAKSENVF